MLLNLTVGAVSLQWQEVCNWLQNGSKQHNKMSGVRQRLTTLQNRFEKGQ